MGRWIGAVQQDIFAAAAREEPARHGLKTMELKEADAHGRGVQRPDGPVGGQGHALTRAQGQGRAARAGDRLHARDVSGRSIEGRIAGSRKADHLIGVHPERVAEDELCLPIDGGRHDDEADQDRELGDHQSLAHGNRAGR